MRFSRSIAARLSNERGITLIATALWIMCFFALVAVGIDVARISFTASEVQASADVMALAGARAIADGADEQVAGDTMIGLDGTSPNTINGQSAYVAAATHQVQRGTVDNAGTFTAVAAGAPASAAQATVVATVENLFTGVFGGGNGNTTVTKVAVAGVTGIGEEAPSLPMTIASGCFNSGAANCSAGNCPALNAQTNDAGFTSFLENPGSRTNIRHYVPTVCGGGGQSSDVLRVNQTIHLQNGNVDNLFEDIRCMVCDHDMTEFVVAVIDKACGANFNQTGTITGFAKVTIDKVAYCAGPSTNVVLQSVREAEHPGTTGGGCLNCGYGQVRLF